DRARARVAAQDAEHAGLEIAAMIGRAEATLGRLDTLFHALDVMLRQRAEQRLLGRKVIQQSALAHAGRLSDAFQRHARGAHVADGALGSGQNAITDQTGRGGIFNHRGRPHELTSPRWGPYRLDGTVPAGRYSNRPAGTVTIRLQRRESQILL